MLLCFIRLRSQRAGGFAIRKRDTVTRNRLHLPDAVGHIAAFRITLAEAHSVPLRHGDLFLAIKRHTFSRGFTGRDISLLSFTVSQGDQLIILIHIVDTVVYVINQRHRPLVSCPGRQFAQFTVTDVARDQHRQGDFLPASFPVLPPRFMNQTVQCPPVIIQMGDNQRLRLCLRGPSGIVLHQCLVERRGLACRQAFPLAQRLTYLLFLRRREFHH